MSQSTLPVAVSKPATPPLTIYTPEETPAEVSVGNTVLPTLTAGPKPKRTRRRKIKKPDKPRPDFPLFAHATKRWAKKIRGKLHYFGKWDDPEGALKNYLEQHDWLHVGAKPPAKDNRICVGDLCDKFMVSKQRLVDSKELSPRTWRNYYATCKLVIKYFGDGRPVETLTPEDFEKFRGELAKVGGPARLGNTIGDVRVMLKWAYDSDMIARPVKTGPGFKRPSKKVMALHRARRGERMLEPAQLRQIIETSDPVLKAMVLLALNAGLGNHDLALLRPEHLDLKKGWLKLVRSKTGIMRRCPLWSETIEAVKAAMAVRPKPQDPKNDVLVFLTARGLQCGTDEETSSPISRLFKLRLRVLDLYRPGVSFYALRHVHRTIADEAHDQPAANALMGHVGAGMDVVYRERISDARLQAVVSHIHSWLFGQ
jgi:integrase